MPTMPEILWLLLGLVVGGTVAAIAMATLRMG